MKLGNPTDTQVEGSEQFTSHDFEISDANSAHIFRMLTSYSDPVGSVVREITTNCFDAHRKAGIERDVVIRMNRGSKLDGTDAQIQFEDFGTGLTPDEVENIFTVLGESTKRDNNEEMGAFGIGAKSPFGYLRDRNLGGFTVDTYVDGTHWQYFLAEDAENGPQMTLLLDEDTDRENGTVVTIPIDDGDFYKFKRALRSELAYFENIDFQVQNVSNDYTIYRGKHFVYRPDENPYNKIHACFGKVAYPLDYETLEWSDGGYSSRRKFEAPIGLRFDIGEIQVVPNREQINYTDQTVKAIDEKLEKAQEEFKQMWEDAHSDITTISGLLEARDNKNSSEITLEVGEDEEVGIPYCEKLLPDNSIGMDNIQELSIPDDIFYNFKVHKSVDDEGYINSNARTPHFKNAIHSDNHKSFLVEDKYSPKTNRYIASRYGYDLNNRFYLIKKESHKTAGNKYIIDDPAEDDWDPDEDEQDPLTKGIPLSETDNPEIHKARKRYDKYWNTYQTNQLRDFKSVTESALKELMKFEEMVEEYVKKKTEAYSDVEVSDDFKEYEKKKREQKKQQKKKRRENQFPIKIIEEDSSSSWGSDDYKWKMDEMKYESLNNSTMYVYGFQDDSDDLLDLGDLVYNNPNFDGTRYYNGPDSSKIAVLKIAMKREYLFEDLDNAMHISDFQKGHRIAYRAAHANWIGSKISYNRRDNGTKLLQHFFPKVYFKLKEVDNFGNNYSTSRAQKWGVEVSDDTKKNWKYLEDKITVLEHASESMTDQLPLVQDVRINSSMDWEEFSVYSRAKDLVHPTLWCKKEGIID